MCSAPGKTGAISRRKSDPGKAVAGSLFLVNPFLAARQPLRAIRSFGRSATVQRRLPGLEARVERDPRMSSVTLYRFEEINKQFCLADACGSPLRFDRYKFGRRG